MGADGGNEPYSIRVKDDNLPRLRAGDLGFLFRLALGQARWLAPMAAFMAMGVLSGVPQPLITKEIIDGISPPAESFGDLPLFLMLFAGLVIAGQAASFGRSVCQTRFRQGISAETRRRVLSHVSLLPPRFFDSEETGYLMSRVVGDTMQMEGLVSAQLVSVVTDSARFLGGVVILFALHSKLALASAVTLPLLALSVRLFRRRMGRISNRQMELGAEFWKDVQETFAGMMLIKSRGAESERSGRLMAGVGRMFEAERKAVVTSAASAAAMALAVSAGVVVVLWFGANEVLAGRLSLGGLVAFNAYLGYLYGPSRSLSYFPMAVQPAIAAFKRLKLVLEMAPERPDGLKPAAVRGAARFSGVTFSYGGRRPALDGISFAIEAGEKVGITGRSGAGKSTLAKLILGFYRPGAGEVLLDGNEVSEYSPAHLRPRIGYLPQDAFFFSDTIKANLAWAAPAASEAEMLRAVEEAGLGDFLKGLENGLESRVGERGLKLSGGERQRLAVARAFLWKPDMLILDESTSHLDPETERKVRSAVLAESGGRTVIVIANRTAALEGLDRIFVLEEGRIVQEGKLEDLKAADGPFRRIQGS